MLFILYSAAKCTVLAALFHRDEDENFWDFTAILSV